LKKRLENLLERNRDLISNVENIQEIKRGKLLILKAKIILVDNSTLYIREIWNENKLIVYSYYWFNAAGEFIEGWDNAPHHKEINTFPHHRHTIKGVEKLEDYRLTTFFKSIRKKIL